MKYGEVTEALPPKEFNGTLVMLRPQSKLSQNIIVNNLCNSGYTSLPNHSAKSALNVLTNFSPDCPTHFSLFPPHFPDSLSDFSPKFCWRVCIQDFSCSLAPFPSDFSHSFPPFSSHVVP
jgi:hypothetical protein